jgi:23S rRNA (cytidine1920-2'-O)/16S rRNA (cytidine1409-2'-O)-methyltransferase
MMTQDTASFIYPLRLDSYLFECGLCESRAKAQGVIMAGLVIINGQKASKPGMLLKKPPEKLELLGPEHPYVSRGGLKLEKALSRFGISAKSRVCLDVGASTGGFTDCLLQQGAVHVYAVDVGYNQLHWKLRTHEQVTNWEKTHIRNLGEKFSENPLLTGPPSLTVVDVSFISLTKVLPFIHTALQEVAPEESHDLITLLKPQFELLDFVPAEKTRQFDGIVREKEHLTNIFEGFYHAIPGVLPGWQLSQATESPIVGAKGNREFLLHFQPENVSKHPSLSQAGFHALLGF